MSNQTPQSPTVTTRTTSIRTSLLAEPQDALSSDTLLSHLMHVEAKDVTLKFVFDHIRNYAICGALMYGGVRAITLKVVLPYTAAVQWLGGGLLIFAALLLFGLNFIHGITAFSKIRNLSTVSKVWYSVGIALLLVGAGVLVAPHAV